MWINGPEFQRTLNDLFAHNGDFKEGNLIVWQDDQGKPSHSGIMNSVDELSTVRGVIGMATEVEAIRRWYLNLKYGQSHAFYEPR